jgi:glycosyltransferase involved in cell wall biosynthesis
MEATSTEVSIIIPVFNEEGLLETAINDLAMKLAELGWEKEIIITENGSTDRTVEIAKALAARYPFVKVLHTSEPNYGKALRRGIETAVGKYCICDEIDICDVGFHKAALDILRTGEVDMVVGSKRHPDARDARPAFRRFATWVVNFMLRIATGFRGTDTHGLKAFNRQATMPVVERCIVEKDMFTSELVIRAERLIRVREIPVTIVEKRPPAINLFRRVPNVLRNIVRLFVIIRLGKKA